MYNVSSGVSFPLFSLTGEVQPWKPCTCAVIFPSETSLLNAVSVISDTKIFRPHHCDCTIFTVQFAENVRVAMTFGCSATLEKDLSQCCESNADLIVLYPALLTDTLAPTRGSTHELEICKWVTINAIPTQDDNIPNLVAGLFQSACPESVRKILKSSNHYVLLPCTWVQSPVQVNGIVHSDCSPLFYCEFRGFKVHHVAVCTGQAEKTSTKKKPTLHDLLDPTHDCVCNYIRVAIMDILRTLEREQCVVERAIYLAAKISVPEWILSSPDDVTPKRMLPIPYSDSGLKRNQRIMSDFFLLHVARCLISLPNIERFTTELVGAVGLVEAQTSAREEGQEVGSGELVYQVFLQWKQRAGRDIDFVPLINVFEKLQHAELRDLCQMFVTEHSFRFQMHQLCCSPCFAGE